MMREKRLTKLKTCIIYISLLFLSSQNIFQLRHCYYKTKYVYVYSRKLEFINTTPVMPCTCVCVCARVRACELWRHALFFEVTPIRGVTTPMNTDNSTRTLFYTQDNYLTGLHTTFKYLSNYIIFKTTVYVCI